MEKQILNGLDEQLLEQCKKAQLNEHFDRTVTGSSEIVAFLPGSSIRFWLNDESCEYALHWHTAVEMIIPLVNTYTIEIGQERYELHPGDIFMIPSGELHHLIAPESGKRLIYLFDFELLSRIRGFSFLSSYMSQPILITKDTCRPIYNEEALLISQMLNDYLSSDSLREITIYSKLMTFFVNYARYRIAQEQADGDNAASTDLRQQDLIDKFNVVFDYLDEHFMEDISLEDVANIAGFSKFYFSRLFKQYQNCNFYDYLCYKRIKSAETLLLKPDNSITEIALQSGFSSLSTFNRTFKKVKGCTPSEYRSLFSITN